MMRKESLPDGLEFPSFSSVELSRLVTPFIHTQGNYLVYIIQIPLLQSAPYQLYKIQTFLVQQDNVFVYVEPAKDFIFVDAMRQRYDKMNYPELLACLKPNELTHTCKETQPIRTQHKLHKKIVKLNFFILTQPHSLKVCVNKEF
jgi:hypothetical protein